MTSFLFGRGAPGAVRVGDYEVGETLGAGTTSEVKLGREKGGRLLALKMIDPAVFRRRDVQQELEILRYFGEPRNRHPNVSGLVAVLHDVPCEERRCSVIVTEYMDSGDLFAYLEAGIPLDEGTSRAVFQQVVRGVSHLHKHGVVHLDIKPENILLASNGIIKLTDFGLSEIVKPLRRRVKRRPQGIRAVSSLSSLASMNSFDSSPSPMTAFYPPNTLGVTTRIVGSGSSPSSDFFGPEEEEEVDDTALFEAISTGRTRRSATTTTDAEEEDDGGPRRTQSSAAAGASAGLASASGTLSTASGMRHSASVNGLSGMGHKVASYNSICSLESNSSLYSRSSRESKSSTSRFSSPRLVVSSRSGTLCYQAPEVNVGNYDGAKADVFSLGIVLHIMLYGVLPFDGAHDGEHPWEEPSLLQHAVNVSPEAVELLTGMLDLDPKTRFSLKDVMRHPWVDASQVRGSVRRVAALVKRRGHYVRESRQAAARQMRRAGDADLTQLESEIFT